MSVYVCVHRRTGTFELGGLTGLLLCYTMPESVSVVPLKSQQNQKRSQFFKSNETVIIPGKVILKPQMLYDLA